MRTSRVSYAPRGTLAPSSREPSTGQRSKYSLSLSQAVHTVAAHTALSAAPLEPAGSRYELGFSVRIRGKSPGSHLFTARQGDSTVQHAFGISTIVERVTGVRRVVFRNEKHLPRWGFGLTAPSPGT